MSIRVQIILLALILALAGNCQEKKGEIIATVGEDQITYEDYLQQFRNNLGVLESDTDRVAKAIEFLNHAIDERVLIQEGYRTGLDKDQEIQLLVDGQRSRFLLDELYKVKIIEKAKPSVADIKAYYNKLKEQLHLKHILVKEKKEAEEIYSLLKKGANFDTLAQERSFDPSKESGGDLGWVSWGMMVDPFQEAAWKLKSQQISRPVKTQFGWHIIKLEERKKVETLPAFAQAQESIGKRLDSVKRRQLVESFLDKLKKKTNLKFNIPTWELLQTRDTHMMAQDTSLSRRPPGSYLDSTLFGIDERSLPLVSYKGGKMSLGDFLQNYTTAPPFRRSALNDLEAIKQFVFQILMPELLEKETRRLKLEQSKGYKENIAKLTEKMMLDKMRNDIVLGPVNSVTEEEIKAYYETHKDQFMHPEQVRVQEIMLSSQEEATAILKQLKAGANFSKLARQKTLRANAKEKAGDLGYFPQSQYPGLFNACQTLKVGELAGPVLQGGSFSVIKFLGRKQPALKTYPEAKREAETKALTEKKQLTYANWISQKKALVKIEINSELLSEKLEQEFAILDQTPKPKKISGTFPFKVKVGPGGVIEQVK
ncbi:MAG: hypothetical protein A2145_06590 [candidate division Zixibacteria bacterium RBG_16_40_9]|nr:MAG: hypothetical protein A2145_06590 [candidate division Zixibacteria bacterium RBG_16_40_9]